MPPAPTRASAPRGEPLVPTGLLLVRGDLDAVVSWAGRGLTAVRVVPLDDGWCALVPATPRSAVPPPYDDPAALLLNRPVPGRLRPAVGVSVQGRRALVAATSAKWRAVRRWVAWQEGTGMVRPGRLPTLKLADLVHLAGLRGPDAATRLRTLAEVMHDADGDPVGLLRDVLTALRLPGGGLLGVPLGEGSAYAGAVAVEPSERGTSAFAAMVTDDAAWSEELSAALGRPDDRLGEHTEERAADGATRAEKAETKEGSG